MRISSSGRKIACNRRNAKKSTGPKSIVGKSRSAQIAFAHGLAVPARTIAGLQADIQALALSIALAAGAKVVTDAALQAAEAQVEIFRIRAIRGSLRASDIAWEELNQRLTSLERYERRVLAAESLTTMVVRL